MSENKTFFDTIRAAQAVGEPVALYKKGILGIVCVSVVDPFSGSPKELLLKGNPEDPATDIDDISVVFWTDFEHEYFRRANKPLLEKGYMVPFTKSGPPPEPSVNEVSDEVLKEALEKKFFAVKALLDRFTSPAPVMRMLHMAEDMNKQVGTLNAIKKRLSELQAEPEEREEEK